MTEVSRRGNLGVVRAVSGMAIALTLIGFGCGGAVAAPAGSDVGFEL